MFTFTCLYVSYLFILFVHIYFILVVYLTVHYSPGVANVTLAGWVHIVFGYAREPIASDS